MSEPFDPIDKAYADAESLLSDDAARAARRARVLSALAETPAVTPKPRAWRIAAYLSAASLAGVVVLLANRIDTPRSPEPAADAGAEAVAALPPALASAETGDLPPARPAPSRPAHGSSPPPPRSVLPTSPPPVERRTPPPPMAVPAAPATPAPAPAPLLAEAPSATRGEPGLEELVVTAARRPLSTATVERLGERLRAAASRGDRAEVERLLARGAPVDEADTTGETALMKSVRARQAETVILLRARGASLDVRNSAGQTARDLAAAINDPRVNRALEQD